jgi:hypothetical protein
MRWLGIAGLALIIAGCGAQNADEDGQVDPVTATQLELQVIGFPDMEKHDIYGFGCGFAPVDETGASGIGSVAVLLSDRGFIKLDGEIVAFVPQPSAEKSAAGIPTAYSSEGYALSFDLTEPSNTGQGQESSGFSAQITIRDGLDSAVYETQGYAQCGA